MRTVHYDALVIGLGVMGSACADTLARKGLSVLGVERSPEHDGDGASFGGSRLFRAHPGKPALTAAGRAAARLWADLEHDAARPLFVPTGGVTVCADPAEFAASGSRVLTRTEMRNLLPGVRIAADEYGVLEPDAGILLAEDCVAALRARAVRSGARLQFGHTADPIDLTNTDGPVRVRIGAETVTTERLVLATGAWAAAMELDGMPELSVERAVVHWLADPVPTPAPFVIFDQDPTPFGLFPAVGGRAAKFGRFSTGVLVDPLDPATGVDPATVSDDLAQLRDRLPAVGTRPGLRSTVCRYTNTPDGALTVARPTRRVAAVCACSGIGFKFAPVVGQLVADVLTDGRTEYSSDAVTVCGPGESPATGDGLPTA
ncbi:FAD-dependent oxidoreductase [Nocardia sp. NPDC019395]|uniref:FAD-dependent oxidoreductase n=1 Tax=Nocardia sp. NPDC019395 TaxID=3154686 RepID=UPI00340EE435